MRLWTIGMTFLLMVSHGYAQEKGEQRLITVTGKLVKIVAIGGETTGWAVDLDSSLKIDGKKLNRIEIDPNREKIDGFNNKRIKIIGALKKRSGIERKEYWVIAVNKIQEIKTK